MKIGIQFGFWIPCRNLVLSLSKKRNGKQGDGFCKVTLLSKAILSLVDIFVILKIRQYLKNLVPSPSSLDTFASLSMTNAGMPF